MATNSALLRSALDFLARLTAALVSDRVATRCVVTARTTCTWSLTAVPLVADCPEFGVVHHYGTPSRREQPLPARHAHKAKYVARVQTYGHLTVGIQRERNAVTRIGGATELAPATYFF